MIFQQQFNGATPWHSSLSILARGRRLAWTVGFATAGLRAILPVAPDHAATGYGITPDIVHAEPYGSAASST